MAVSEGSQRFPPGNLAMMGQAQGHTRMYVVRDLNQLVRPVTMMTSKVTIQKTSNSPWTGLRKMLFRNHHRFRLEVTER